MARQRGHGWQGDRTVLGRRERRTFNTKAEAEAWEMGEDNNPNPRFNAVADEVFERRWANGNNVRNVKAHIMEMFDFFGQTTHVATINTVSVERFKSHLMLQKGNSGATVNRKLATLSAILDHARRLGFVDRLPEIDYERESMGKLRFLEDREVEEFIAVTDDRDWLKAFMFLLDTGCRYSEMAGAEIRINECIPIARFVDTKNGTSRSVPLTAQAIAATKLNVPPQMAYDTFHRLFTLYKERTSMRDDDQVTPHTLRHTCATRLVKAGIPLYTVSKWLGHSSIRTTERYAHLSVSDLSAAAAALER